MLCTIRQAAECHPPVGRGTGKRVGTENLLTWGCGNGSGGHWGRRKRLWLFLLKELSSEFQLCSPHLTALASLLFLGLGTCLVLLELLHLFVLLKIIKIGFENSIGLKGEQESMFGKKLKLFSVCKSKMRERKIHSHVSWKKASPPTGFPVIIQSSEASFAEALSILLSGLVHILVRNPFKNRFKACMKIGLTS